MAFGDIENQSARLEDEETGLTKNPKRKEETEFDDADNKQAKVDTPEGYTGGKRERQDRVDPSNRELLTGSIYENYYEDASLDDLKQTIDYLSKIRQQANEVKLLRFVTGRSGEKPGSDPAGIIQNRPDLEDLFSVGSLSNPDENTRYMTDVSAAHDLIEYLVAETEAAIKRKEAESAEGDEYGPGADRADLPTDTAENPGDVPEQVKEGRYERNEGDNQNSEEEEESEPETDEGDDEGGRGETRLTKKPERKEVPGSSEEEQEEPESEEEDGPDPEQEEPEAEKEPDEEPDVPGPEQLRDEPEELTEARRKYLKGLRLRGKMVRGRNLQKMFEWFGADRRSVEFEGEEMFFDGDHGKENLERLRENYEIQFQASREEKITQFVESLPENVTEAQREQAITNFSLNLLQAEQQNENEAYEVLDENFDDASFREWWRKDETQQKRRWASGLLLGGGVAAGVATAGTASAGAAIARGGLAGAGAYVGTEERLESVHGGGANPLSRTGFTADLRSEVLDNVDQDVKSIADKGIGQKLYDTAKSKMGGDVDTLDFNQVNQIEDVADQVVQDMPAEQLEREMSRLRMLANEEGVSIQEAATGGDVVTSSIIEQLMERERRQLADDAIGAVEGDVEAGLQEDEAVYNALMNHFDTEEGYLDESLEKMESFAEDERKKKMWRRAIATGVGGTVGWFIGGDGLKTTVDKFGDIDMPGWPWGEGAPETPPNGGPGMSELPPEMQPEPDAETIFDVEVTDWDGQEVYGDQTKARSFIEATGDIKAQMEDLDAFDVAGGQGTALNNLQAAENLQDFLGEDIANDLAERLDGYRPEQIKESLVVHPGETLSVTKEGNLILEQTSGETELLYDGANDEVIEKTFKDDLFGDFDDVSGGQAAADVAASDIPDAETVEAADTQPVSDTNLDTDLQRNISMPETGEALKRISNRSQEANGVLKGAMNSFVDAGGNPTYIDNVQLPAGVSQDEFTTHIQQLNQSQNPLSHLHEVAQNNPEQFRSLQSLIDGYAEFHLDPSSDMGVAETEDLKSLYTALDNYLDQGAPEITTADVSGVDTAPSLEEQLEQTPQSVDAEAPEPPSDEASQTNSERSGGTITGEGRGAQVEQPNNQSGQEVVGEGRGAQTMPEEASETQQQSQAGADKASEQPAEIEGESQSTNTTESEAETTPAADPNQGSESIQVDTGEEAIGSEAELSPQERVAADGITGAEVTANEVDSLNLSDSIESPHSYLGNEAIPLASTAGDSYPPLQDVSAEDWISLTDTFKGAESFSAGVNELANNNQTKQLKAVFEVLQAEGDRVWDTGYSPDKDGLKVMQSFVSDKYEEIAGQSIPDAIRQE